MRELMDRLDEWVRIARALVARPTLTDDERCEEFVRLIRVDLRRHMSEAEAENYERAGRFDYSWYGLKRYVTKVMQPTPGTKGCATHFSLSAPDPLAPRETPEPRTRRAQAGRARS